MRQGLPTNDSAPAASDSSAFPVTVESALGTAEISDEPTRVATWGWSNQDAILALGVVPVAMPTFAEAQYGADDRGILQWDATVLNDLGGETPKLLSGDGTGAAPIEQFAEANPDLIFAPYSGLSQAEFDALSRIAPVVGYPDQPWTASWEDQLTIAGTALGKEKEAAELVSGVESSIADAAAKYPALSGKTVTIALPNAPGTFAVSKNGDVRVEFLEQLGLVNEPTIQEADPTKDPDAVYFELSLEQASSIRADVLFVVAYDKESLGAFLAEPAVASQPVLAEGRTASTENFGVDKNFAFGGLTVLTIPYILDDVASALNAAAGNVQD
ncbi:ABC transporter substrate-binding protein [Rhodococcoides kyotonense]|uniref:Iron complex transport system substrate-binding protein n=1 Tax=Rhodococcoides kyotonense TaxID=398843 RepID=A0A239H3K0_9NOCA|nr:ABC transporter substrate-binding protein [Rhodococcus kyotonensis]SNS75979.1 iron complex transport system substrate-binding protein [Rhodococcus kyotonensis]